MSGGQRRAHKMRNGKPDGCDPHACATRLPLPPLMYGCVARGSQPTEPPLALVEEEALNEGMRNKRQGHSRGHCRGMTFVEVAQRYVSRRGGPAVQDGAPEVQVNAIMVLKGYPRILTGEIIAHEVMHAWLKSRRVLSLRPEVEEGLCELMGEGACTHWTAGPMHSETQYGRNVMRKNDE